MIQMASDGIAAPAYRMANPELVAFASDAGTTYDYNPARAKELLTQAGYPDGFDVGTISTLNGTYDKLAQVFQSNLAEIGIRGSIQVFESSSYITDVFTGNYTIGVFGGPVGSDMNDYSVFYLSNLFNQGNIARHVNPQLDDLFARGMAEIDDAKRQGIYDEAVSLIQDSALYIPVMNAVQVTAYDEDLNYSSAKRFAFAYDWSWN